MYWCSWCQHEAVGETCPDCGNKTAMLACPPDENPAKAEWHFGFSSKEEGPEWPLGPDGKPERGVLLTQTGDFGADGDMTQAMLRAFGIPVVSRYPGDGSFGRVMLGFSGYGRELYVPEGQRALARELLRAPGTESEELE